MRKGLFILLLLMLFVGCRKQHVFHTYNEKIDLESNPCEASSLTPDSLNGFIVIYRQPVNGYQVKAIVNPAVSDMPIMSADLMFTKSGKSFTLHTSCFGDTLFCKGRMDYGEENTDIFKRCMNKTIEADYHENREEGESLPIHTPFFFRDLDFDGVEELVIVHYSMAVRYHNGYDVYRIVDDEPFLIDYPPYKANDEFGMTDYAEIDFKNKTISCPHPEGELSRTNLTLYGISKKEKDIVEVNGKKHYFNHIEPVEEIEL